MGWMSWQRFGCETDCDADPEFCLSENLIKITADSLVEGGFRDAGYEYIHIDDCWLLRDRDLETGAMVADPKRFPSGIKSLADYVHDRGLKLGIYSDIGPKTCQGFPGLAGNFETDALTFASWGIDSIKVDGCYMEAASMKEAYADFGDALNKSGRPILYSCSWPAYQDDHCENESDFQALARSCNLWMNYDDIEDSWESTRNIIKFWSRNATDLIVRSAGPGGWNNPDMLLLGNPGLSNSEAEVQFLLWCLFSAPLYLSTEVDKISDELRALATNPEIIAVNQDSLGKQGYLIKDDGYGRKVFARPLIGGRIAVVLFNERAAFFPLKLKLNSVDLGWSEGQAFKARDLVRRVDLPIVIQGRLELPVDVSSAIMLLLEKVSLDALDSMLPIEMTI